MKRLLPAFLFCMVIVVFFSCKKDEPPAAPVISAISPNAAAIGDTVTISGNYFATNTGDNLVTFNNTNAVVVEANATQLKVIIPAGVTSGTNVVSVVVGGQAATYQFTFSKLAAVTTIAGKANGVGFLDGTGAIARFSAPSGIAVDAAGNVYVSDFIDQRIRKISPAGVVTTLAGNGTSATVNGTGTSASFLSPYHMTIDQFGNLYVAERVSSSIVRKITPAGVVTTLAGGASSANAGSPDGIGTGAYFASITGLTVDPSGNVFVSEGSENRIRKISGLGAVTTFAGTSGSLGSSDGAGTAAKFVKPAGLTSDALGNIYVTDISNNNIRKITSAGVVTTFAGNATKPFGFADGTGTGAQFSSPTDITTDAAGNMYVMDETNRRVRKVTAAGVVTTVFIMGQGSAQFPNRDGNINVATFSLASKIAIDASGNFYIPEYYVNTVRKVSF